MPRKKRNQTYGTQYPIDLLLYSEGALAPEDVVIPYIESAFHHGSCLGPFRRLWFMGRPNERCLYVLSASVQSDATIDVD